MDGVHLRPEDKTAGSPWARPVILVDRAKEYPMPDIDGALYPKQLTHAIQRLTNKSLHPTLKDIMAQGANESQARATTDQVLGATLFLVAVVLLLMMMACYKRAIAWGWIGRPEDRENATGAVRCPTWLSVLRPSATVLEMSNERDNPVDLP